MCISHESLLWSTKAWARVLPLALGTMGARACRRQAAKMEEGGGKSLTQAAWLSTIPGTSAIHATGYT